MRCIIAVGMAILFLVSCSSSTETTQHEAGLSSLLKQYHEEYFQLFPVEATLAGDDRYNSLLPNTLTAAYRNQIKEFYSRYRNQLTAINKDELSEDDKINYDVLLWECDIALEGLQFKDYLIPINQFWDTRLLIAQLASGESFQPFKTVKDYDNWLLRLDAYIEWCDSAIVNMKIGIAEKYVIPKSLAQKVIPQLEVMDHGPVTDHLYYGPIKNFPTDFPAEEKERLTKAYQEKIQSGIIPVHRKLKDFMMKEYIPACRESSGIDALPYGKDYYSYLIKLSTTTAKSADEIFAIGEREVARITEEMEAVKGQVGFKGDLKSFLAQLRTQKELTPFTKPEQVIDNFNAIHERMRPNLSKLFDKTPKTPFEVRRTKAFREASASPEYFRGSQDGSRPGIFYVPIPDINKYNVISDESLFLHEAIPGHHYQIALQSENSNLPDFRRVLLYSSYAEGWGLYAESLGKELGLYTDPYQYLGMLSAEMHRAIRLVVDIGLHTRGWTREQAIQYSREHEAVPEDRIVSEIERYMSIPGQALSYKVGQLKIQELRNKAEKILGSKFSITQFHNEVLESAMPLSVLENKINRWINSEKNKTQ